MSANDTDAARKQSFATRLPIAALGCTLLAVAIRLLPGVAELLQFDRGAIAAGEIWRVVTGHLTHWILQPAQALYRGLSGIDSALFVFQAIWLAREALSEKRFAASVLPMVALAGFAVKVGYEYVSGCTLFVDAAAAGFAPLPLVHVIGGLVGAAVVVAREAATRLTRVDEGLWCQWSARLSR